MTAPLLVVRADASAEVGSGHLIRCLALAQAFRDCGGETVLVTRGTPPPELADHAVRLPAGVSEESEVAQTVALAAERQAAWVAVDGYTLPRGLEEALHQRGLRVLSLDDSGTRRAAYADLVLDQTATTSAYGDAEVLLGPEFVLLRRELRLASVARERGAERVLVTFGGSDPLRLTRPVVERLQERGGFHIRAVVGPHAEALPPLEGVEVIVSAPSMVPHLVWADLAIGAAGSTTWELAFTGTPSVLVRAAENQRAVVDTATSAGVATAAAPDPAAIVDALAALAADRARASLMAENGRRLIDGRGALRVVQILRERAGLDTIDELVFHAARAEDSDLLLRLRNDEQTRRNSLDSGEVPLAAHERWLSASLRSPTRRLYVVHERGAPIGTVRFDQRPGETELSWTVAPEARGRGLGRRLLLAARCMARGRLIATIKRSNEASQRMALSAGFHDLDPSREPATFVLDRP